MRERRRTCCGSAPQLAESLPAAATARWVANRPADWGKCAGSAATVSQTNTGFDPGGPISFQSSGQTLAGNPGPGPAGQCVSLTVTSVNGSTISAKTAGGSAVTIHTTSTTQYSKNGQSVGQASVTVGSMIRVMGTHNSDGSITATSIDIG